jgi:hypothetical protein
LKDCLPSSVDDTFAAFIPSRLALIIYITCICRLQETITDIKLKQHHKRLFWASLETDARHSFWGGDCTFQSLLAKSVDGTWDENGFKAQIAMKSSLPDFSLGGIILKTSSPIIKFYAPCSPNAPFHPPHFRP